MKTLYFATHNEGKLKEVKEILGVDVKAAGFEVDEIQSLDPTEVAIKKARGYFEVLHKPIFAEDVSFFIESLQGLPGPYIDGFMKTLGNEGIVGLMKGKEDRRATVYATVVFVPKKGVEEVFIGQVEGTIANKPKGQGFGWDPIFIPGKQKRTFGEMSLAEKNKYSMRAKAFGKFKVWLYENGLSKKSI